MSLLDWWNQIFNSQRAYRRHEDCYGLNRAALVQGVRRAIERQSELQNAIWLVTHRQQTFREIQDALDSWNFRYEIEIDPITRDRIQHDNLLAPGSIRLILAALVDEPISIQPTESSNHPPVSIMVLDRSRDLAADQALQAFCRQLPARVELGYFLSLDDEVVGDVVDPTSRLVLEQLGLTQHELITSNLITKRIERHLSRKRDSK